jgi:ribosomal-protein-alanine N-acetyltransferase
VDGGRQRQIRTKGMATTRSRFPKRTVKLDCGKYLVRTITADDASDRWAGWLADPEASHMLNAPATAMTRKDLVAYIQAFDQRSRLLLGIFEKATGKHLGFFRIDIDHRSGKFLVSMLIGEPDYRHKGVTNEVTVPFRDYFFETLGLNAMLATALSHNRPIIHYLYKSGWVLDRTLKRHVKSHADGTMLDLCFFSLTRDAWRAWKKANLSSAI